MPAGAGAPMQEYSYASSYPAAQSGGYYTAAAPTMASSASFTATMQQPGYYQAGASSYVPAPTASFVPQPSYGMGSYVPPTMPQSGSFTAMPASNSFMAMGAPGSMSFATAGMPQFQFY